MTKINVKDCDEETKLAAKTLYERYCANADWLNYRGERCPMWESLTTAVQSHWCAVAEFANDISLLSARLFVTERLAHMKTRPQMYASTKESFGVQLLLLAEVALQPMNGTPSGLSPTSKLALAIWGPGNVVPAEPLDGAWAAEAVASTSAFLDEQCGTSSSR